MEPLGRSRCSEGLELLDATGLPSSPHGVGVGFADVFPVPEIGLLDVELEDVVVVVDDVARNGAHHVTRVWCLMRTASEDELIVASTRKAVQHTARVAT